MQTLWFAIRAGGALDIVWDENRKCYYSPGFSSHDAASDFWFSQTHKQAWAIGEFVVEPKAAEKPK